MTIEKEFVGQLRRLDEAALSKRLHSPEKAVALRPVADILCFISLVDHLTKNTPFRKEVQLVQIARVEMQAGRGTRRIPFKVMPDEDDPSRFVVVQPDPDTGELVPQLHRGKKRLIEKAQNGMWRPVKG